MSKPKIEYSKMLQVHQMATQVFFTILQAQTIKGAVAEYPKLSEPLEIAKSAYEYAEAFMEYGETFESTYDVQEPKMHMPDVVMQSPFTEGNFEIVDGIPTPRTNEPPVTPPGSTS